MTPHNMAAGAKNNHLSFITQPGIFSGTLIVSVFFTILFVLAVTHPSETRNFTLLLKNADWRWLALAILIQIPTYPLTGAVWRVVVRAAKHHLSIRSVSELALMQLSVNQIIPAGGVAGNVFIVRAMRRLGIPTPLALEVFFVETLSYHVAFSLVTMLSMIALWWHNSITPIIVSLVSIFFTVELAIVALVWGAINHKKIYLPEWLTKRKFVSRILSAMEDVAGHRIFSARVLLETSIFRFSVFLLDTLTLLAVMRAIGVEEGLLNSFVALVIASVAGAIAIIPGGVGGFEAGSVIILLILGATLSTAIAITLIFRILTLWLPLLPGLILAHNDFRSRDEPSEATSFLRPNDGP